MIVPLFQYSDESNFKIKNICNARTQIVMLTWSFTWPVYKTPGPLLCEPRITETVYRINLINRTAMVCNPYAWWCGREEPQGFFLSKHGS